MKIEKIINVVAILLIAALGIAGFMTMYHTAESNLVTADIAKVQSQHKKRVLIEVGLLTAEIRNLQKDVEEVKESLKDIKNEKQNQINK